MDNTISIASKKHLAGIAMATFASFGGILLGYDTGTINGILQMPDWLRTFGNPVSNADGAVIVHFAIPTSTESLVVSILSAGTFLGKPAPRLCGSFAFAEAVVRRCSRWCTDRRCPRAPNWHPCLMYRVLPRRCPSNRCACSPNLHRRSLLRRLWCRSHLHARPHVPIRVLAEMDQRCRRLLLVVDNHGRPPPRFGHQQRYEGAPGPFCVANSHRRPVRVGSYTLHWHGLAPRGMLRVFFLGLH